MNYAMRDKCYFSNDHFSGFTLIELLVVISVMVLIFGLGYANFRGFRRRQMVESAARQIRGDLRLAQEQALAGAKPATDCPTLNGYNFYPRLAERRYEIVPNCEGGFPAPIKSVELPEDIAININSRCYAMPSSVPWFLCWWIGCPPISCELILFKVLGQGTNIPVGSTVTITVGLHSEITGWDCESFPYFWCDWSNAEPIDIVVTSTGEIR
jgi:prepilin-type N-terminal cleavage/methylation domain-containing protein